MNFRDRAISTHVQGSNRETPYTSLGHEGLGWGTKEVRQARGMLIESTNQHYGLRSSRPVRIAHLAKAEGCLDVTTLHRAGCFAAHRSV